MENYLLILHRSVLRGSKIIICILYKIKCFTDLLKNYYYCGKIIARVSLNTTNYISLKQQNTFYFHENQLFRKNCHEESKLVGFTKRLNIAIGATSTKNIWHQAFY